MTDGSLPALLLRNASGPLANRPAYRRKRLGVWEETTWRDYAARAARVGLALERLGVRKGDRVAIAATNVPEWLLVDLGAQGIGAITVGIYPTSPAAEVEYLLAHSGSKVVVCEDQEQFDKVIEVRGRLKDLEHIVVVDTRGIADGSRPDYVDFADLETGEDSAALGPFSERVRSIVPSDTAIIVYTSGTTGPPKGAMLSHANLLAAGEGFAAAFHASPDDEILSYLPLCHVAERLTSGINALATGYVVNFGEGGESFSQDLREVQPTFFLGVPRVWEKMLAATEIRMADASFLKRASYGWATRRGQALAPKRMTGDLGAIDKMVSFVAWLICFRQLRRKLGLGRIRVAISGAAPIAPQVLEWFWAIGVPVREGYGQTEGAALGTFTPEGKVKIGTVGIPVPGVELRLADDGEILVRSPGVFVGYLNDAKATKATIDKDGWLHTGDVGTIDDDGYVTITDRKKDIIITAGGKNLSPSEIENRLKVSPFIREAVVIGDRRKYLVALIGIEMDTVGAWATRRNIAYTTYADLSGKPEVIDLIQAAVDDANADLAQVEQVKRFALLPKELDHEEGELTATMKVKRAAIASEFGPLIESLYGAPATEPAAAPA